MFGFEFEKLVNGTFIVIREDPEGELGYIITRENGKVQTITTRATKLEAYQLAGEWMKEAGFVENRDGTNYNKDLQAHYGVIHSNKVDGDWYGDIMSSSDCVDLDYTEAREEAEYFLKAIFEEHKTSNSICDEIRKLEWPSERDMIRLCQMIPDNPDAEDKEGLIEEILDLWNDGYNSDGPSRFLYNDGCGLVFEIDRDGDIFVTSSHWAAYTKGCSPCAPNAGHLESGEGPFKSLALPPDAFSTESPCPYTPFPIDEHGDPIPADKADVPEGWDHI